MSCSTRIQGTLCRFPVAGSRSEPATRRPWQDTESRVYKGTACRYPEEVAPGYGDSTLIPGEGGDVEVGTVY